MLKSKKRGVVELHDATTELKAEQPPFPLGVGAAVVEGVTGVGVGDGLIGVGVGLLSAGVDPGAANMLPTSVQIPCHESTTVNSDTSAVAAQDAQLSTALSKMSGYHPPDWS
jgi:hypothetical protein